MARVREQRFDLRGGLNLAHSDDTLDFYEVRSARNARAGEYGSLKKRAGTQRVHVTTIGSGGTVLGLHQWNPSGSNSLVAIAGGNLYHKLQGATNFTTVSGDFASGVRPCFAVHVIAGVPSLFIADGSLTEWDGSSISGVAGAPDATQIAVYKTRMFATDGTKTIYWSKVSDPFEWASAEGGGQAFVETYDALGITALEVVGSSLLIFKANSIARFTGVTEADIRIGQETEGISPDIGTKAPGTVIRVEDRVFFLSDRGPYWATESGVEPAGVNVESALRAWAQDYAENAVAVHHKGATELWVFGPASGETTNTVGYCLNYRLNSWTGPWEFSGAFSVAAAGEYELDDGTESVVLGGYDGLVRRGDVSAVGAKDDVLRAGTGGTNITMALELPDLFFGDPTAIKRLAPTQHFAMDLGTVGSASLLWTGDQTTGTVTSTIPTAGSGVRQYTARPGIVGRRVGLTIQEATAEMVQVNGLVLEADTMRRVA